MLSQLEKLTRETDGRYATDAELMFLQTYLKTARLRFRAYQKLKAAESTIVKSLTTQMKAMDPTLLQSNGQEQLDKCQRDARYFLRYITHAVLVDDEEGLQEYLLHWWQTILRALKLERQYRMRQILIEEILKQHLTPEEVSLITPILAVTRSILLTEN
jgi:hypothetical protein